MIFQEKNDTMIKNIRLRIELQKECFPLRGVRVSASDSGDSNSLNRECVLRTEQEEKT